MERYSGRHINRINSQDKSVNVKFKEPRADRDNKQSEISINPSPNGGRRRKHRTGIEHELAYDTNFQIEPTLIWELPGNVPSPRLDAATTILKALYKSLPPDEIDKIINRYLRIGLNSIISTAAEIVCGDPEAVEVLDYPNIITDFLVSLNDDN